MPTENAEQLIAHHRKLSEQMMEAITWEDARELLQVTLQLESLGYVLNEYNGVWELSNA